MSAQAVVMLWAFCMSHLRLAASVEGGAVRR